VDLGVRIGGLGGLRIGCVVIVQSFLGPLITLLLLTAAFTDEKGEGNGKQEEDSGDHANSDRDRLGLILSARLRNR
jgi:hypothetical protein